MKHGEGTAHLPTGGTPRPMPWVCGEYAGGRYEIQGGHHTVAVVPIFKPTVHPDRPDRMVYDQYDPDAIATLRLILAAPVMRAAIESAIARLRDSSGDGAALLDLADELEAALPSVVEEASP